MTLTLKKAAERLGLGHHELTKRMREKGLLSKDNLPANPVATKDLLVTREGRWYHEEHGMQYPRSTRVTVIGLPWLARKLGIELPMPPALPDRRDVA